jgi:hypothetical protein
LVGARSAPTTIFCVVFVVLIYLFVCLLLCVPQGRDVFANYTGTMLQVSIIIPSTRSTLPPGLGQNPPRGPTATHHLSLPGPWYQTLLTACQTSSPVEVYSYTYSILYSIGVGVKLKTFANKSYTISQMTKYLNSVNAFFLSPIWRYFFV